ncbi:MAG: hypothetical protein Q4D29_06295 [Lachnospiraceae bacterium]|nr:hypothetical protein [Lachnospiraceae bacterium]
MTEEVRFEAEQKNMEATLYGLVGAKEPGFEDFLTKGLEKAYAMLESEVVTKKVI